MTNDIKVGDVLRRVTDSSGHFTMGNDYEVLEVDRGLIQVNDDGGWRYNLGDESARVNFTVIRETPRLVKVDGHIRTGSLVRVVKAEPSEGDYYKNGDIFEVGLVWGSGDGFTTTQGTEIWMYEVEKVADESPKTTVGDAVVQPNHYTQGKFEVIEIIEEISGGYEDGFTAYAVGNVVKYLARAPHKHDTPLEDLRKAERYIQYAIERQISLNS